METIKKIWKNEGFKYLFFGVLATLVYVIIKWISYQTFQSGWLSETLAQSTAIIFAFFTNKIWVFQHKSENIFKEFTTFVVGRIVLLLFCILMNWWFIDLHPEILMNALSISKNLMVAGLSLFLQVFTIAVNYIYSKFIVFRKKTA